MKIPNHPSASGFAAQIRLGFDLFHAVLYDMLVGFKSCHDTCNRTVLVQFQNKVGLLPHDVFVEVFNKGVGSASKIGHMKAEGLWTSDQLPGFPSHIRDDQLRRHTWQTYEKINLKEKPWEQTKV